MPELALLDEIVLVEYMAGDEGALRLVNQLLSGEVSLALPASTALHLWCHEVSDRKAEIQLFALMRFMEQIPLSGDMARAAGSIYTRDRADLPEDVVQATLKAINAATSLDLGLPIYSRDVEWYESRGCNVVSY